MPYDFVILYPCVPPSTARRIGPNRQRNVSEQKGGIENVEKITEVAKYFLSKDAMTHKKLQKLCYYAQAWHLANYDTPLVPSRFEAWVHGPVSPDLYFVYRDWGWLPIPQTDVGEAHLLSPQSKTLLDLVYATYGHFSGDQLENITHQEAPWQEARSGCEKTEYCRNIISEEKMRNFYGSRIGKNDGKSS